MGPMTSPNLNARQIADVLSDRIRSGQYPPGEPIPLSRELAAEFGTSRATITVATRHLANEGLVYLPRSGARITVSPLHGRILRDGTNRYQPRERERDGARGAFEAEVVQAGLSSSWTTNVALYVDAPEHVRRIFGDGLDARYVVRSRVMRIGEVITQTATSYIPERIARGTAIEAIDSGPGGIKSRMGEIGFGQHTIVEDLIFRPPSEEEQEALGIGAHQGMVELTHVGMTAGGPGDPEVVEVAIHLMPAHLWRFRYSTELAGE